MDLGPTLARRLFDALMIDDEWSLWHNDRSFTWWPNSYAQKVTALESWQDDEFWITPIRVETDLAKGVAEGKGNLMRAAAGFCTMSGIAPDPDNRSRLRQTATLRVHEETADGMIRLAMLAAVLQAGDSELMGTLFSLKGEIQEDVSEHPTSGARKTPDEVLDYVDDELVPIGDEKLRVTPEGLAPLIEQLSSPPVLRKRVEPGLVELLLPMGNFPTSLSINTVEHPLYNKGILFLHEIPLPDLTMDEKADFALDLMLEEREPRLQLYSLGGWFPSERGVAHALFLPNVILSERLLMSLTLGAYGRYVWVCAQENIDPHESYASVEPRLREIGAL